MPNLQRGYQGKKCMQQQGGLTKGDRQGLSRRGAGGGGRAVGDEQEGMAAYSDPRRWPMDEMRGAAAWKRTWGGPVTRGWGANLQKKKKKK